MADARDYVLAVENNKPVAAEIARHTAESLQEKRTTLIEVVQSLGEYINDEDEKIRARAVSYLTAVIAALPPKYLSRQQIQVLCQFLCDRIEDGGAIEGLSQLQNLDRFTNEMAQIVVRAVFEHFSDLQRIGQSGRHRILQLLNGLMTSRRKALREMGDESLTGILDLVMGEKDPRNLMIIFSMLRVLSVEWDISNHTKEAFDASFAYFPITFRPPPNDPYGITAQDLKDRLRECISATGALSSYSFPALLEKLDSTSTITKKDVLQALAACAKNFDTATISTYSVTLWDSVKFEVLTAQEPELADEALLVLKAIAERLSKSVNTSPTSSPLVQFLKPIDKECIEHLQEPSHRQAKASGDILKAVSSASVQAFGIVIKAVIAPIAVVYQSADAILQKRALLEVVNQLFESAMEIFGSRRSSTLSFANVELNLLSEFKDNFFGIYSQALMGTTKEEVSFRLTAAKGLLLMSTLPSYLEENEIGLVVQYFDEIVLIEESYGRDELKKVAMTGLSDISRFKPQLLMNITFPAFMAKLPDTEEDAEATNGYLSTLEGLAEISTEKGLLETLMRRLLNKLDILLQGPNRRTYPYTCAILSTVLYVLNRSAEEDKASLEDYYFRIVTGLSRQAASTTAPGALVNEQVLDLLGRIDNLIVRHTSAARQEEVSHNIYRLFQSNGAQSHPSTSIPVPGRPPQSMILSTWLLAAIPRDFKSDMFTTQQIGRTLDELRAFAQSSGSVPVEITSLHQIALYINKHLPPADLQTANHALSSVLVSLVESESTMSETADARFSLHLLFTIAKALILRLAPNTNDILSEMVSLLDSSKYPPHVSASAARAFGTILAPDNVLSKTNLAQIRLLAPQRVFQVLAPLISTKFKESSLPEEKENYLTALSGVLASVPSEIVMPELPNLLPLLLQSLDLADQAVKIATLETLAIVIANNPAALEESGHIPALVKRLLSSASTPKPSNNAHQVPSLPQTRRLAAKCLALLPAKITGGGSRTNPLLALKREVLQGLATVLDDVKRDVRKEAVDARAAWIRGVDDPEEDEDD